VVALWELCQQYDVAPALLVVPNWHGAWPLVKHPGFTAWIHTCIEAGAEVLLHGERHDELGLPRSARHSMRAFGRTANEGEFLTLDHEGAATRIARGLTLFQTLHFEPIGFVPPAWLAGEATFGAVKSSGLRVSEDAFGVRVHSRDERLPAAAVRWSSRTTTRARVSSVLATVRWHTQHKQSLIRLALHPQDLAHPITARSVRREVANWLTLGCVVRYADL